MNVHYQSKLFQRIPTSGANILNTFRFGLVACQHNKTAIKQLNGEQIKHQNTPFPTLKQQIYKVRLHHLTSFFFQKKFRKKNLGELTKNLGELVTT